MNKIFIYIILSIISVSISFAQNMDWQYATRFGGNNYQISGGIACLNHPNNLVIDNEGNAYIFGTYGTSTIINGEELPDFGDSHSGACVIKFDCNGNILWHKAIARSGNRDCQAQYMILKNNRLYLQGTIHIDQHYSTFFLDTTVFGDVLTYYYNYHPDSLTFPFIPYSNYTYIMELDLNGNIVNYNIFEMEQSYIQRSRTLTEIWPAEIRNRVPFSIDSQGNYYMPLKHGYSDINRPKNFFLKQNGIPITDTIIPNTLASYYIVKFDSDFNFQYIKPLVECIHNQYWSLGSHIYDMECDSEDNIYLCGYIQVNDTTSNPSYPYDVELADDKHIYSYTKAPIGFIIKMNSYGNVLWVSHTRNYGHECSQSNFESMLLDETLGNIYVSGYAMPIVQYPSGNYTVFGDTDTLINSYDGDGFVNLAHIIACYDTSGNYKWYSCPITQDCIIGELTTYNEKLYAAVWFEEDITCGENTYHTSANSSGIGYAIGEWNRQGNMTNIQQIYCIGQNETFPYGTLTNSLGEMYTSGRFDNTIAFGTDTLFAHSESDMFIAKFGLPCQTYLYDTATYCYGEVQQGVTFTTSGDYTLVYPEGGQEIDSIVLVHATVLPQLTIGLSDTTVCTAQQFYLDACGEFDSYQWSTGGTGCTEMLQFDNACTQSVSLTVTRGECSATRTISITAQVCDGITEPTATAMSLYPNPATDMVSIFGDGFVSATVIDINGRIVLQTTAMQLDLSGLRPGEYIVKVVKIDGETEELKLIKE